MYVLWYVDFSLHLYSLRNRPLCPAPGKAGFPGAEGGAPRWGTTRSPVPDKGGGYEGFWTGVGENRIGISWMRKSNDKQNGWTGKKVI